MNPELIFFLIIFFTSASLIIVLLMIYHQLKSKSIRKMKTAFSQSIISSDGKPDLKLIHHKPELFLQTLIETLQSMSIDEARVKKIFNEITPLKLDRRYIKMLFNPFSAYTRIKGAMFLGYLQTEQGRSALEKLILKEKKETVRLYAAYSLCQIRHPDSIPILIETLKTGSPWYTEKIIPSIIGYGIILASRMPEFINCKTGAIPEMILHLASKIPSSELKQYCHEVLLNQDDRLIPLSLSAIEKFYPDLLLHSDYYHHQSFQVRKASYRSVMSRKNTESLKELLNIYHRASFQSHPQSREILHETASVISETLLYEPSLISHAEKIMLKSEHISDEEVLAESLSVKTDLYFSRLLEKKRNDSKWILTRIIRQGYYSDIIAFLNTNKNIEIENELLDVLKKEIPAQEKLKEQIEYYASERICKKLKLESKTFDKKRKEEPLEKEKVIVLKLLLFFIIFSVPAIFLILKWNLILNGSIRDFLSSYVILFNHILAYYSGTINLIYILILFLSFLGLSQQSKLWNIKNRLFLFSEGVLPSISVIAPAYCEEATIIESVNSLLNLEYPDYDLIVINDGSSDQTLHTLINYYNLQKIDRQYQTEIRTMPIRGIYINPSYPKLTVVDKFNGGKADSLNVGINLSRKDYFCGIDADSLLETDALLKIASYAVDTSKEYIAAGGNIFPVNGCSIQRGDIIKTDIPKNSLARFQTVEYIRAFMAGRIGWSYMKNLLIISGAFGLFKRDRFIEIGGYLTSSGIYHKDTVGEDMELVVRLKRMMLEKKIPHHIHYAYHANCWTEVPEDMKALQRQRDRWHRGLIDILFFHRKMIFNPEYKNTGLIGFPYFLIFETIGPFFEAQGYLMVLLAAILGLINAELALLLFLTTILMGIFISISALMMEEQGNQLFSWKQMGILLFYAVLENFGFRQIISFWRVSGYISAMKKTKGWGKMVRKGFSKKT